jgi:hypothetical protein
MALPLLCFFTLFLLMIEKLTKCYFFCRLDVLRVSRGDSGAGLVPGHEPHASPPGC